MFPGSKPGAHINPGHLAHRLNRHFEARAARLGSLNQDMKLSPVTIIAEALGYAARTLEAHAVDSGATYGLYLSTVKQLADRADSRQQQNG